MKAKTPQNELHRKSNERVKKYGEVFTPEWMVVKMCDMLENENGVSCWQGTVLEPSCGTGNFLVEIMKRKLAIGMSETEAARTLFGIDILADNVEESIQRLTELAPTAESIFRKNIVQGKCGRNPNNPSDRFAGIATEQRLEVNMQGTSNCLTSVQKDNLVIESQVLTPKRTEYGKAIRKAYESGKVQESRHNMTELEPRTDGILNTLTTVQKDNLVIEPQYRIRKLTPRECGRLMGVSDEDISKMAAVNSNSQLYKQFGNSIIVDVMCAMFRNLNIKQEENYGD